MRRSDRASYGHCVAFTYTERTVFDFQQIQLVLVAVSPNVLFEFATDDGDGSRLIGQTCANPHGERRKLPVNACIVAGEIIGGCSRISIT